jgi:regulator of replication initiation timing
MSPTQEEMWAEENRRLRAENEALRIQIQELETLRRHLEHTVAVYKRCVLLR